MVTLTTDDHARVDWTKLPRGIYHRRALVQLVPRGDRLGYGRVSLACRGWCGKRGRDDCMRPSFFLEPPRCCGETDAVISRFRAEYVGRLLSRGSDLRGRYLGWDGCAYTHARGRWWGFPARRMYVLAPFRGRFWLGVGRSEYADRSAVAEELMAQLRDRFKESAGRVAGYYVHPSHLAGAWEDTPIARDLAGRTERFHRPGTPSGQLLGAMLDEALVDLDVAMEQAA